MTENGKNESEKPGQNPCDNCPGSAFLADGCPIRKEARERTPSPLNDQAQKAVDLLTQQIPGVTATGAREAAERRNLAIIAKQTEIIRDLLAVMTHPCLGYPCTGCSIGEDSCPRKDGERLRDHWTKAMAAIAAAELLQGVKDV